MNRFIPFLMMLMALTASAAPPREFSLDLWDWTQPCRDLATYPLWVEDLKEVGVTRVEISAPWNVLEPAPGEIDVSFVTDRLKIAKANGMGLRVRINSYYGGATPAWFAGDRWRDIDGREPTGTPVPVSICDERFWEHYLPVCTALARACKGEDVLFNPFIGIHAELKFADWWSYDVATLARWKKEIEATPRAPWLSDVAGDAALPDVPPVPGPTRGTPDRSAVSRAWIAFREQVWRDAVDRFNEAIREGDPRARTSAPLGESFRRESAQFSNLDYWGMSRKMQQIVHSYDFYWHPRDDEWMAAAAVASFRGISGIDDVVFEFDGPALVQRLGYDVERQVRIAAAAMSEGAGLKAANYSYDPTLPSQWPALQRFGDLTRSALPPIAPSPPNQTILLFVSKWANYCYREKTEWLHDAQFGAWKMLKDQGFSVRFVCEDNLAEDLTGYRGIYIAYSPPDLLPTSSRRRLDALTGTIPSIVELSTTPSAAPTVCATPKPRGSASQVILDYPLGWQWLRGDRRACATLLEKSIPQSWN